MPAPTDASDWEPPRLQHRESFVATVVQRRDGTATCTIAPLPNGEQERQPEWITAREGSFVSLAEMR